MAADQKRATITYQGTLLEAWKIANPELAAMSIGKIFDVILKRELNNTNT